MVESLPTAVASNETPDWSTLFHDLVCPLCTYNLRGLTDPRCPECGYSFTWRAILEARRTVHPYLFEHYPHRKLWSFTRTTFAGFRPRSFWARLSPAHSIHTGCLLTYWLLHTALLLSITVAVFSSAIYTAITNLNTNRARYITFAAANGMKNSLQWLDAIAPPPASWRGLKLISNGLISNSGNRYLVPYLGFVLLWPWLTFLSLLIFQQSMRKARIRPAHIFRCCIYSADAAVVIFLAAVTFNIATTLKIPPDTVDWLPTAFVLYASYRLITAYKTYLRFEHVITTILASQIIVALAGWKLTFIWIQS